MFKINFQLDVFMFNSIPNGSVVENGKRKTEKCCSGNALHDGSVGDRGRHVQFDVFVFNSIPHGSEVESRHIHVASPIH